MAISERRKQTLKAWREKNKQKLLKYFAKYRKNNKNKIKKYAYEYNNKNKKYVKEYMKRYKKLYVAKNRDKIRKQSRKYKNIKYKTDVGYKLLQNYRSRLKSALKLQGLRKISKTSELIGCTIPEFKKQMSALFKKGMNWKNHGYGRDKWHIDHIIPCSFFDLSDKTELKICFHYTNLQPMWQNENFNKSDKIIDRAMLLVNKF